MGKRTDGKRNDGDGGRGDGGDRGDAAAYIAALSVGLRDIARRNDLPTIAYLLDMAHLEAETEARAHLDDDAPSRAPGRAAGGPAVSPTDPPA